MTRLGFSDNSLGPKWKLLETMYRGTGMARYRIGYCDTPHVFQPVHYKSDLTTFNHKTGVISATGVIVIVIVIVIGLKICGLSIWSY